MEKCIIELKNIHKTFSGNEVVKGIDLKVGEGEFLTLLGPSGCGKTTTLRMIAGFEDPSEGQLFISGEDMSTVPPYNRPVNTVFQSYALFPLMNVYDNIAYGLTVKKLPKGVIKEKVTQALKTVQLEGFEKRKIKQLSGGQKQRIAIARAIVNDPKVLLLDEPLGALDFKLRKQMQIELKQLQKKLGITFIYVTHDQEEAMTMSDRIAVMNCGVIEQIDVPEMIYSRPKTRFTADFIGESNIIEAELTPSDMSKAPDISVSSALKAVDNDLKLNEGLVCASSEIPPASDLHPDSFTTPYGTVLADAKDCIPGEKVFLCVRPESMKASEEPVPGFSVKGTVIDTVCTGNLVKTFFDAGGEKKLMLSKLSGSGTFEKGQQVFLFWDPENCGVMKK